MDAIAGVGWEREAYMSEERGDLTLKILIAVLLVVGLLIVFVVVPALNPNITDKAWRITTHCQYSATGENKAYCDMVNATIDSQTATASAATATAKASVSPWWHFWGH